MMPMFGMNAANKKQPGWATIADAVTHKIDGDEYNLNWVDWNNDRHQDGWLAYMNLGADSWRKHLEGRIDEMIERYGVDAYFLDIVGGHVNNTNGDMHEGTRRLVTNLRDEVSERALRAARCRTTRCTSSSRCTTRAAAPRWQKYSAILLST